MSASGHHEGEREIAVQEADPAEAGEGEDGAVALDERREIDARREKLERLRAEGVDPYPAMRHLVAGRLISRRGHGKTAFLDVRDLSGSIQVVLRVDSLGQEAYDRI